MSDNGIYFLGTWAHPSGDYGYDYFIIEKRTPDGHTLRNHQQVIDYLLAHSMQAQPYHCGHSWDCCGCQSREYPAIVGLDPITEFWHVRQSWSLNV